MEPKRRSGGSYILVVEGEVSGSSISCFSIPVARMFGVAGDVVVLKVQQQPSDSAAILARGKITSTATADGICSQHCASLPRGGGLKRSCTILGIHKGTLTFINFLFVPATWWH